MKRSGRFPPNHSGVKSELSLGRAEGIAGGDPAAAEALPEPLAALLGGAVGEYLGAHPAGRAPLDPVVTYRGGGGEPLLRIAGIELAALRGRASPHAGVAVRLELEPDRELVSLVGMVALQLPQLGFGAQQ